MELCSALGNARVKGFFEMLFIAWNPAAVKALIPARRDTALPLRTSCFGPICFSLPGCLVVIFVINSPLFYKVLLIGFLSWWKLVIRLVSVSDTLLGGGYTEKLH